jgi:hypothetical protein
MLVGEPVFVWLTGRGQSIAGIDYSVWRPKAGMLAHIAAVTDVRHTGTGCSAANMLQPCCALEAGSGQPVEVRSG